MNGLDVEPSACAWCGIAERGHARQYADAVGWHAWAQPSQEQILARMKARRLQLAVAKAGALPVPVDGVRTLDVVEEELTGVNLALWEEIQAYARLRLALSAAKRGRSRLRAQVAELNEALTSAAEALRARSVKEPSTGGYPPALPWLALMDEDDRVEFLDELAESATVNQSSEVRLAEIERTCATWRLIAEAQHGHNTAPGPDAVTQAFAPVAALREVASREEPHDSPLRQSHRLGHDLPETGGAPTPSASCKACGSAPESWCPDCAACQKGCFGGFEANPCTHPNASWGGPR